MFLLQVVALILQVAIWGGGSSSGTDNGGSPTKPNVTPVNEFPKNPLALLGVYDITSQSVNGTSQEVTAGSEFRVNVSTTKLVNENPAVDVLVRIIINGKTVGFTREISLVGETLGAEFFEKVFTDMGAKVTGEYTLEFTLAGTAYNELVKSSIISDGDTLVINLDKTKNLQMDAGLDDSTETPETPSEPVKVESIQITTHEKSYYTGSTVTIDFTLNPSNTTETDVTYQTTYNGSGTVKAANGKGQLVLENVTQDDTVTFIIANNQQASFHITIVDEVESISFLNATEVIDQNQSRIIAIENYDVIKDAFSSITYSVVDNTKASINSTTGEVTGLKNGVTQVNVTAIRLDGQQLTAQYELDVLGYIDYSSPQAFLESSVGTYEIYFFGTKPGSSTDGSNVTDVTVTNNCNTFIELFSGKCEGEGGFMGLAPNKIELGSNFAGLATITEKNGGIDLITKTYMTASDIKKNSKNDQYQYTLYRTTSYTDPNNANTSVTDVRGRHLTDGFDFPGSTFKVEKYKDEKPLEIKIYSQIMGKQVDASILGTKTINPKTYMLAKKISSKPQTLDYNDVSQAPFNKVGDSPDKPTNMSVDIPYY